MSLKFNGVNSYIAPKGNPSFIIPVDFAFTFSCWFNVPTLNFGTNRQLMGFHAPNSIASNRYTLRICLTSSNALFAQSGSDTAASSSTTTSTIKSDQWHHAAGAFTINYRQAWLNGSASTATTTSLYPSIAARFHAGAAVYDYGDIIVHPFDGLLAHMAIWDEILNPGEILALASKAIPKTVRQNALLGYYPFVKPASFFDTYVTDILNEGFNPNHGTFGDQTTTLFGYNSVFPSPDNPPLTFATPVIQNNKRIFLPPATNRLRSQIAFLKPYAGILPVANG